MNHYLARLSFNRGGWLRPTRDAQATEEEGTYNQVHGYGHEDWLFRDEWHIDGWHYGFVQGVNRSHRRLVALGEPFDLTLFTIEGKNRRRYVARVLAAECLREQDADWALAEFKRQRWYQTMLDEIAAVHGNAEALGNATWAKHVLNVKFRWENVRWFQPSTYAEAGDPICALNYYVLSDLDQLERKEQLKNPKREGSALPPVVRPYMRRAVPATRCTPEHARLQEHLMALLAVEFPGAIIRREREFVDVSVQRENELILFEIKSDLEPKAVIRQALGQILEYAFHPSRRQLLPVRLVLVGQRKPSPDDQAYLDFLRAQFGLPLSYRTVSL
jgi:hypothetical protein